LTEDTAGLNFLKIHSFSATAENPDLKKGWRRYHEHYAWGSLETASGIAHHYPTFRPVAGWFDDPPTRRYTPRFLFRRLRKT